MDEEQQKILRQELLAIDEQISAVNQQIQTLRWRRSREGNRRQMWEDTDMGGVYVTTGGNVACGISQVGEEERRLPTATRVALLREELATALQRYMVLQSRLRVDEVGLPR